MDMRIQTSRPITVQSFSGKGERAVAVSDARQSGPVSAVAAVNPYRSDLASLANDLRQATRTANNGYTDSTRGSKINILA